MDDGNGNERLHSPKAKIARDLAKESRRPRAQGNVPQRPDTAAVPQAKPPVDFPGLQKEGRYDRMVQ